MTDFTIHTPETAPEAARARLQAAKDTLGFVPNLYATMAEAPALLEGYQTLASILEKSDLNATELQIIMMSNNVLNGCEYCMAAHTTLSQMQGVDAAVVTALRDSTPIADAKLEALRLFSIAVNETRGYPTDADIQALLSAGYTRQTVLEVVLATGLKVLSNYTNHIAETPVDDAFAPNAWKAS